MIKKISMLITIIYLHTLINLFKININFVFGTISINNFEFIFRNLDFYNLRPKLWCLYTYFNLSSFKLKIQIKQKKLKDIYLLNFDKFRGYWCKFIIYYYTRNIIKKGDLKKQKGFSLVNPRYWWILELPKSNYNMV